MKFNPNTAKMNKQPCYHYFEYRPADPDHVRYVLSSLVPKKFLYSIEAYSTGGGFTATKDLSDKVRAAFKKAKISLIEIGAEWGDPSDLI